LKNLSIFYGVAAVLFVSAKGGGNGMRQILVLLAFSSILSGAFAQPPIPNKPCKYERLSVLRRVKEPAKYQLDLTFPPELSDLTYTFPVGTIVSVGKQQESWSCVYGSKYTGSMSTQDGWERFSGWIPTSQLEKSPEAPVSSNKP
jgi:hypothetical protein